MNTQRIQYHKLRPRKEDFFHCLLFVPGSLLVFYLSCFSPQYERGYNEPNGLGATELDQPSHGPKNDRPFDQ